MASPESKMEKMGTEASITFNLTNSADIVAGVMLEHLKIYEATFASNGNIIGRPLIMDGIAYMPFQYLGGMKDISQNYNYIDVDKSKRTVYAGYVQGTWNIYEAFPCLKEFGKNLILTAGARFDDYDDVGNSLNPRIGIVYAPNDRFFFKILYGEAFRAPSLAELYYINNPSVLGNPDLKPEKINTAEILAGVNLTEHITATLDFFRVQKKDALVFYQSSSVNRGELESQGVEGEIRASFDKSRYAYFNVTFQKAKDLSHEIITDAGGAVYTQDDFRLGDYPEIIAALGVNSDISRYVNANVSVNYIGSMNRTGKMQFTSSTADPDGTLEKTDKRETVPGYSLVNLSLIFHNFDFAKGWEFQISGYNIFNADQRDPEPSGSVSNDLPRWGRNFMGKITYTF